MLKTTKRYVITTNAVNAYGFRVLTEGIDRSLYDNNPVMLWMHYRADGRKKDEVLPLGNVREIEIDKNGVMTGRLFFDEKDTFAMSIYSKYENGTLNMLSLGTFPIDVSDDPKNMIQGQTGPTVMKSIMKEVSCVDIGANPEACAVALYDESDKMISLSDQSLKSLITHKTEISDMKLVTLSAPAILTLLKLADTSTEAEAVAAIQNLITLSDQQKTTISDLQTKLNDQIKLANATEIKAFVQKAADDRKITMDEVPKYVKLAEIDFPSVKDILNGKVASPSVQSQLQTLSSGGTDHLTTLSWAELDKKGLLVKLKAENFEVFKAKYKEAFNAEYKGKQ